MCLYLHVCIYSKKILITNEQAKVTIPLGDSKIHKENSKGFKSSTLLGNIYELKYF